MDIATAQELVSKLTYKPGWDLQCYPQGPPAGGVVLRFGKDEIDSETLDGAMKPLMFTSVIGGDELTAITRDIFLQRVFDTLVLRELHEVEEWLRLEGVPLREPHPAKHHRGILGDGTSLSPIHPRPGHGVQD